MKILITTDWYSPVINGVVTSVLNLEKELRKMGHEVKVLTLSRSRKSYAEGNVAYVGSMGAGIIYPNARMKIPVHSRLVSKLIEWKPDIIHSQCEFSTFLFARKISKILNIPIVHTYHTVYEDYTHYFSPNQKWGRKAVMKFSRWVTSSCQEVIAPTEKVRQMLLKYNIPCPVSVIPTGINLDKFYSENSDKAWEIRKRFDIKDTDFIAVYIGRLAKEKNIQELIKMHVMLENHGVKLLIVGDGPYREELENLVKKFGISDRVIFTGMASPREVADYYGCGNIFVSASSSETQGLTYIEALASGLPVICKKDKCLDGVIDDIMNGFQYTSQDEYLSVISELAGNPQSVERMSGRALDSSKKFGSRIFGERVSEMYCKIVRNYGKQTELFRAGDKYAEH